jgi:hypothetical protein
MRVSLGFAAILAIVPSACFAQVQPAQSALLAMAAGQLVREVVYNELNDHARHGYWRYWVERRSQSSTRLEEQVETAEGPVTRLAASDGHPLSAEGQREEQVRLARLLASPQEQARHLQQYNEDEQRIGRILVLLPDAFLYEYAGEDNGCYRLRFHPNPDYPAHSIEAHIFHAMSGELWVDARSKRLARLEGRVGDNVDFGFGILGRLYKGGWFKLVRTQVSDSDWKTAQLEVHMSIRALLVKTFARETSEERGGFEPVPAGLDLAHAVNLLDGEVPGQQAGKQMSTAQSMLTQPSALAASTSFSPHK